MTRPLSDVTAVNRLFDLGLTTVEISERAHIPQSTVYSWLRHRMPSHPRSAPAPQLTSLPRSSYSYLLGFYLGDGYLSQQTTGSWLLRATSDSRYPGILDEFALTMEAVSGGTAWRRKRRDKNVFEVGITWWHWLEVLPQHGPGRKHRRRIALEPWQWEIVRDQPWMFLRGLIHSDGWRGLNRVTVKGHDYAYPRY